MGVRPWLVWAYIGALFVAAVVMRETNYVLPTWLQVILGLVIIAAWVNQFRIERKRRRQRRVRNAWHDT